MVVDYLFKKERELAEPPKTRQERMEKASAILAMGKLSVDAVIAEL